ncbi:MAG: magnesium chelatase subunit H [Alphaproteobacteria bacterium]
MQKPISAANLAPVRVVIVTLDHHLAGTIDRAAAVVRRQVPNLTVSLHAATDWSTDSRALERAKQDIASGDIIIATMLFLEDQIEAIRPALEARREHCDAMVCAMASGDIVKLTRLGRLRMDGEPGGALGLLKRLRGAKKPGQPAGAQQMAMLKRLPQFLRFIPGKAQDLRAYFLTLQYWLAGSEENMANLISYLIDRYADGPRKGLRGVVKSNAPAEYPETGLYHPALPQRFATKVEALPRPANATGTVGLIILRSYVLAGNSAHYDGVIAALEARGLAVVPAFAAGLDARPAMDAFFKDKAGARVDAVVSLTGFSLVGGPAYNDAKAAEVALSGLDVPYIAAHAIEFQSLQQWGGSQRGLSPVESTIMVAIPEIDGATGPTVFGGRADPGVTCTGCERRCDFPAATTNRNMQLCGDRADRLADRVAKLVTLRRMPRDKRKVAIVLFNFPPNAGNTGSAAFLAVFESLHRTLIAMKAAGYRVDVPASVDVLRERIIAGNASKFGAHANVHARISADDHVRHERYLPEIEKQWGPAPGRAQSDGSSLFVLGDMFGDIFVGVQPAFGYEGDPMRLLFENGFAPTHAFSAFYRWIRKDFGAHAVLHFGTHGALEFMPGKQVGLSGACWPDRLIGDLPNIYLYASNNPSEGMLAKRRSAATLISYLTPPLSHAGLYRGLVDLKASMERWRALDPEATAERERLEQLITTQAQGLDLMGENDAVNVPHLAEQVLELEYTLIPHGLHIVGQRLGVEERIDMLMSVADATHGRNPPRAAIEALVGGLHPHDAAALSIPTGAESERAMFTELARIDTYLDGSYEIDGILRALDGRFIAPATGGDLLRTTDILPTGRNIHGFDPFRIPSPFAMREGSRLAEKVIERHMADGNSFPQTVAIVLWGTDNLKTEGSPIAQALTLLGARPRFDGYGRLAGADLIPLDVLGRPRIDVMVTLSGIFRDLLPLQTKLLAEACFLAASADEPVEQNYVRAHALAYQATKGCDLETASLRVFSNADSAYGANVNQLVDAGTWTNEDELAEAYEKRKSFAYGRNGQPSSQGALLQSVLANVDLAYQNLDSVELGITTIDHYFDTLGGISRAVGRARGKTMPVYIGDQTRAEGRIRTLSEQVAIETRTRTLNPRWYEGMLSHGYEGVRQIEAQVTNTMGWSATTGQVAPWVYQQISETYVLDRAMRERLAALNPNACAKVVGRLLEAHERNYWTPDPEVLAQLRDAVDDLEDRIEGIPTKIPA